MRNLGVTGTGGKLTKGYLAHANMPSIALRFQYNPETFTDNIGVEYREIRSPGITYPLYQYVGGEPRTIEFTLFLDAREKSVDPFGSSTDLVKNANKVRETINFLNTFLPGGGGVDDQFVAPPEMIFGFGWFVKRCILVGMPTRYTMFDSNLQPLRAEVDLKFNIVQ